MRQHATVGDGGADQCVELLVTADGQLEMAGRNTLDLEVLGGVLASFVSYLSRGTGCTATTGRRREDAAVAARQRRAEGRWGMTHSCQLQDLGGQVLEHGCDIDGGLGAHTHLVLGVLLQESLDTTAGELCMVRDGPA